MLALTPRTVLSARFVKYASQAGTSLKLEMLIAWNVLQALTFQKLALHLQAIVLPVQEIPLHQ